MDIEIESPYKHQELLKVPTLDPTVFNRHLRNIPVPQPESPLDGGVYEQLNQIFSEQDTERKTVLEAREILGESAESLTDHEVHNLVSTAQFLIDTWMEEFERSIFDGKTFNELFHINPV